jgi:hypothetical protein
MDLPSELPDKAFTLTRADFRDPEFRRLFAQKGLFLKWKQAAECPCQVSSAVDHGLDLQNIDDINVNPTFNASCPVCKGKGLIYHSEQTIQAIVTKAEDDFLNAKYGGYKDATVNISLLPEHLPCFGDQFELQESVMVYRETLAVTAANTITTRFPIVSRDMNLATGITTINVLYAHKANPANGQAVVGGELIRGVDFEVVDGAISWLVKPAVGTRVSFSYYIHPTYTCVSYPNSVRDTHVLRKSATDKLVPMPIQIQAKLAFLELQE